MTNEKISESGETPLSITPQENRQSKAIVEGGSSESTSIESRNEKGRFAKLRKNGFVRKCWRLATWTPNRCRWDPEDPPQFSMGLNLLFGFVSYFLPALLCILSSSSNDQNVYKCYARSKNSRLFISRTNFPRAGTFTVANLYYNHPILNILADEFHVTNERASLVPTVMQAGYAAGLLFLCPLGDIFRRRAFVLILVWFTATLVSQCPLGQLEM
jgi:hypothetical protein